MPTTLVSLSINSGNTFSSDFKISGQFKVITSGTWSGTVSIQQKYASDYSDLDRITQNVSKKYNGDGIYRIGVKSGDYTSGTIVCSLQLVNPNDLDTNYDDVIDNSISRGGVYWATTEAEVVAAQSNSAVTSVVNTAPWSMSAIRTLTKPLRCEAGAIITTTGYTLTLSGGFEAGNYQCFSGTGTVLFGSNTILDGRVHPEWWYSGSGSFDSAIQYAINSIPYEYSTYESVNIYEMILSFSGRDIYEITSPITITDKDSFIIEGSGNNLIYNSTSGSDVIRLNYGGSGAKNQIIRNIRLLGSGTTSRAIYAYYGEHMRLDRVNCIGHPGTVLYLEHCTFAEIFQVLGQSSQDVTQFVDTSGAGNHYVSCRIRENGIGVEIINGTDIIFQSCYIESNNRGTSRIGAKLDTTAQSAGSNPTRHVTFMNCYFENNTEKGIDADHCYHVSIRNCSFQGSISSVADGLVYDQLDLAGGGDLIDCSAQAVRVTSANSVVTVVRSYGFYGRTTALRIHGAHPPFDPSHRNDATDSWMDSDPSWTSVGTTAPVITYVDTEGFLGTHSVKVDFTTAMTGYSGSRVLMDNTLLSVNQYDMYRAILTAKSTVANQPLGIRIKATEEWATTGCLSDTEWNYYLLAGTLLNSASGTSELWTFPAATPTSNFSTYFSAIGVAINGDPSLKNTSWTALDEHSVEFRSLQTSELSLHVPTYADNAAALTGGLVTGDVYRTSTGTLMIVY